MTLAEIQAAAASLEAGIAGLEVEDAGLAEVTAELAAVNAVLDSRDAQIQIVLVTAGDITLTPDDRLALIIDTLEPQP